MGTETGKGNSCGRPPSCGEMTTRAFTDEEVRLMDAALLERSKYRERLFLSMALDTGFRVSELVSLNWSQLLTPSGEISREATVERAQLKGGTGPRRGAIRSRRVPLTERVRGAVADYLGSMKSVPKGPVFKSRVGDNKAISRVQAHRLLKGLARELGLDCRRLACHSARKFFAARVHRAGGFDLIKTQRILGHSSPLVTARYLDTTREDLDALVLGLDQAPAVASAAALTPAVGTSAAALRRFQ